MAVLQWLAAGILLSCGIYGIQQQYARIDNPNIQPNMLLSTLVTIVAVGCSYYLFMNGWGPSNIPKNGVSPSTFLSALVVSSVTTEFYYSFLRFIVIMIVIVVALLVLVVFRSSPAPSKEHRANPPKQRGKQRGK